MTEHISRSVVGLSDESDIMRTTGEVENGGVEGVYVCNEATLSKFIVEFFERACSVIDVFEFPSSLGVKLYISLEKGPELTGLHVVRIYGLELLP